MTLLCSVAFGSIWRHVWLIATGKGGANGIWLFDTRGAADTSRCTRPPPTITNFLAPNIHATEVEKLWSRSDPAGFSSSCQMTPACPRASGHSTFHRCRSGRENASYLLSCKGMGTKILRCSLEILQNERSAVEVLEKVSVLSCRRSPQPGLDLITLKSSGRLCEIQVIKLR